MFSVFKHDLRKIATVFLISITLFLGAAFNIGNTSPAIADSITRDVTNAEMGGSVNDAEYEVAKANRRQEQAMRSELAEQNKDNETIGEKLNLDEVLPRSTKKFTEQIKGNEPIDNETRP